MALTDSQITRIKFHLDLASDRFEAFQVVRNASLFTLDANQERLLVGTIVPGNPSNVSWDGEEIATAKSVLGRVEKAWATLDTDTIEDSLYVAKVGDIALRGSELDKREKLYKRALRDLYSVVGVNLDPARVGFM
jgi:hypothetical protein